MVTVTDAYIALRLHVVLMSLIISADRIVQPNVSLIIICGHAKQFAIVVV